MKFHFSSDWKFTAIVLGLNANSSYTCLWCNYSTQLRLGRHKLK